MDIARFTSIATANPDAGRITVQGEGDQATAVRSKRGFFGKVMNWLTNPTGQEAETNRATVNAFAQALTERFGARIGAQAFHAQARLLESGQPLNARTIREVVKAAEALESGELLRSDQLRAIAGEPLPGAQGKKFSSIMTSVDAYFSTPNIIRALHREGFISTEDARKSLQSFERNRPRHLLSIEKKAGELLQELRSSGMPEESGPIVALQKCIENTRSSYANWANTSAPVPRDFSQLRLTPGSELQSEYLGQGQMASVERIRYSGREGEETFVFKPEPRRSEGGKPVHQPMGVEGNSPRNANLAGRAVAFAKLDDLLEMGLVPRTEFALHNGKVGVAQEFVPGEQLVKTKGINLPPGTDDDTRITLLSQPPDPSEYLIEGSPRDLERLNSLRGEDGSIPDTEENQAAIRELLPRISLKRVVPSSVARTDFTAPEMQKALVDAQLLDLLAGQTDRNTGNFIYKPDGGVALIDNDLAFGGEFRSLDEEHLSQTKLRGLPPVVDRTTANKILELEPGDLRESLKGTGLTEREITATLVRLDQLQTHLRNLDEQDRLVDHWDDTTLRLLTTPPDGTEENNYVSQQLGARWDKMQTSPLRLDILRDQPELITQDLAVGGQRLLALLQSLPPLQEDGQGPRAELFRLMRNATLENPTQARTAFRVVRDSCGPEGGVVTPEHFQQYQQNLTWALNTFFTGSSDTMETETLRGVALNEAFNEGLISFGMLDDMVNMGSTGLLDIIGDSQESAMTARGQMLLGAPAMETFPSIRKFDETQEPLLLVTNFLKSKMLQNAPENPALTEFLRKSDAIKLGGVLNYKARLIAAAGGEIGARVEVSGLDANSSTCRDIYKRITPSFLRQLEETPVHERSEFLRNTLGIEPLELTWTHRASSSNPDGKLEATIGGLEATPEQVSKDYLARFLLGQLEPQEE